MKAKSWDIPVRARADTSSNLYRWLKPALPTMDREQWWAAASQCIKAALNIPGHFVNCYYADTGSTAPYIRKNSGDSVFLDFALTVDRCKDSFSCAWTS